jgi:ABC-2 type transport system permease protein
MDLADSWTIAAKDFSVFKMKRYVIYSLVVPPLIVSIGLPTFLRVLIAVRHISPARISTVLDAFSFFFVMLAIGLPIALASYSVIGEKLEKSLEPLLATPLADEELLLGKTIAALLPSLATVYAGALAFMVLGDAFTRHELGYLFFPNWRVAVLFLMVIPAVCLFSVEMGIIVSSRVNDTRAATQLGALALIPFAVLYVMFENDFIPFTVVSLLAICAGTASVDAALLRFTRSIFQREEILTKWK